ncbi:hypothetical protein OEZ85_011680 [Tetradesmus obliquus]|uniref:Uncharacterized protein n=1 Tax=Tetradesmus obliquus TaxID=3088 RepID=A0ABY8TR48_TETOB|nr:hypothetical protein OEZ85_011680 [Tetradesmus obliquus]
MLKPCSSSRQRNLRSPAAPAVYNLSQAASPKHLLHPARAVRTAAATAAAAGDPVLVHDGVAVPAPASPQTLLKQHRQWSYTTALARQGCLVVDWQLHLQRLIRNAQLLGQQRPPTYAKFLAWLEEQQDTAAATAALDAAVRPQVAQALQMLTSADQQQQQQQEVQAMVTVLVRDPQHDISESQPGCPPLSVLVWAKQVPPAAASSPAKLLVAGGPRELAQAKHCGWALQRQPLEQLKQQAGADEARVLQACQQLRLKVLQQPARPEQRHAWREAFLTNCVRGIQPVASVQLPDGSTWQAPAAGGSSMTQQLQQVVAELQVVTDMTL